MNFLRVVAAGILALAAAASASAEETSGSALAMETSTSFGWTSNAEGAATGRSDVFSTHSLSAQAIHAGQDFALRGSIAFQSTTYRRLAAENDWTIDLSFQAEYAPTPASLVKLDGALGYAEDGSAFPAGPGTLAAVTPELRGGLGIDFVQQFGATTLTLGAGYDHHHFGATRFSQPLVPPIRSRAHVSILNARAHAEHRLDANLAVTGLVRLDHGWISPADAAAFGRLGASVLRLGSGISAAYGDYASFALGGGADIVFAQDNALPVRALPYGEADISLGLLKDLTLRAGFSTSTAMTDPADGYLDWLLESRVSLVYALLEGAEIEAALSAGERTSVAFLAGTERNWGGEIALRVPVSERTAASLSLGHKRVSGLAPAYRETRVALMLASAI